MGIIIYSVPHTGTRFVKSFFCHCGIQEENRHVGRLIPRHDDDKIVIPVRNPYDCYLSWWYLNRDNDTELVGLWGKLVWRSREGAFFFPLDAKDRDGVMSAAYKYATGKETEDFKSFSWNPVSESGRDHSLECPQYMKNSLSFAYEWYEYYTVNWGLHPPS